MKVIFTLLVLLVVPFGGLVIYSYQDVVEQDIHLMRIEQACQDLFSQLSIKTVGFRTTLVALSKEEADTILRDKYEGSVLMDGMLRLNEAVYSGNDSLNQVIVQSPPFTICVYDGYNLDGMTLESVSAGIKVQDSSSLMTRIDTENIRHNTAMLHLKDLTFFDRANLAVSILSR